MKLHLLVVCLISIVSSISAGHVRRQAGYCYTSDNHIGLCIPLANCPSLLHFYNSNGASNYAVDILKEAHWRCNNDFVSGQPTICCAIQNTNIYSQSYFSSYIVPNQPSFPYYFIDQGYYHSPHHLPNIHPTYHPQEATAQGFDLDSPVLNLNLNQSQQQKPKETEGTMNSFLEQFVQLASISNSSNATMPTDQDVNQEPLDYRIIGCVNPDGNEGSCVDLTECPTYLTRLQANPSNATVIQFLLRSNMACKTKPPVICCPNMNNGELPQRELYVKSIPSENVGLPKPEEGCGRSNVTHNKIVGGRPAKQGSWPWLALLAYSGANGPAFRCGGSLVTNRHVITAAHCLERSLRFVRFGEHDLATEAEARHQDVNIVRYAAHSNYQRSSGLNDIGIIYLAREVQFTSNIGLICVPEIETFEPRSLVGYTPFVAGWGLLSENSTKSATVLQEVQLPILSNKDCERRYRAQNLVRANNQFGEAVLCAGELSGGKDTCRGDSGGPLMLPKKLGADQFYYNLIGVVSYGIGCARAGSPGVYANVLNFSNWIKEKIAEPI